MLTCLIITLICKKIILWRRRFFKFRQYIFSLFRYYLPSVRGVVLHLNTSPSFDWRWIPFTQGCFVPSLVETGPVHNGLIWNPFIQICFVYPSKFDLKWLYMYSYGLQCNFAFATSISLSRGTWSVIQANLNPFYRVLLCANLVELHLSTVDFNKLSMNFY